MDFHCGIFLWGIFPSGHLHGCVSSYFHPTKGIKEQPHQVPIFLAPTTISNIIYYFKPYCHAKHAGQKHTSWHNSKRAKCPAPSPKFEALIPKFEALITYYKNRTTICLETLRLWLLSNQFWHEDHVSTAISLDLVNLNFFNHILSLNI